MIPGLSILNSKNRVVRYSTVRESPDWGLERTCMDGNRVGRSHRLHVPTIIAGCGLGVSGDSVSAPDLKKIPESAKVDDQYKDTPLHSPFSSE